MSWSCPKCKATDNDESIILCTSCGWTFTEEEITEQLNKQELEYLGESVGSALHHLKGGSSISEATALIVNMGYEEKEAAQIVNEAYSTLSKKNFKSARNMMFSGIMLFLFGIGVFGVSRVVLDSIGFVLTVSGLVGWGFKLFFKGFQKYTRYS